jgi:hypothetical protein
MALMPRALPKNVSLGRVIATRQFTVRGQPRHTAELRIGEPRTFDRDAHCPVQLVGVGDEKVRPIFGVDTVQALQIAVRYLEPLLLRFGDQLQWEGQPAHKSLNSDPWTLFERAGLSEFLSKFAALCAEHAAKTRPAAGSSKKPRPRRARR